jgi:hypothetical protein
MLVHLIMESGHWPTLQQGTTQEIQANWRDFTNKNEDIIMSMLNTLHQNNSTKLKEVGMGWMNCHGGNSLTLDCSRSVSCTLSLIRSQMRVTPREPGKCMNCKYLHGGSTACCLLHAMICVVFHKTRGCSSHFEVCPHR